MRSIGLGTRGNLLGYFAHELDNSLAFGQVICRHLVNEFRLHGKRFRRICTAGELHGRFELLRESFLRETHGFVSHSGPLVDPCPIRLGHCLDRLWIQVPHRFGIADGWFNYLAVPLHDHRSLQRGWLCTSPRPADQWPEQEALAPWEGSPEGD